MVLVGPQTIYRETGARLWEKSFRLDVQLSESVHEKRNGSEESDNIWNEETEDQLSEWEWCENGKFCFIITRVCISAVYPVSPFAWQMQTTATCRYEEINPLMLVQNVHAS